MYGRKARLPIDLSTDTSPVEDINNEPDLFGAKKGDTYNPGDEFLEAPDAISPGLLTIMKRIYDNIHCIALNSITKAQSRQKQSYDNRH